MVEALHAIAADPFAGIEVTPEKLRAAIQKQEAAVKEKLGCDRVDFKVVVQGGKVKLKAAAG